MYCRDNPTGWNWGFVNLTRDVIGTSQYTDEFYPSLTVDQADGSVYVSYYRSGDGAISLDVRRKETDYVVLRSTDGGVTWEAVHDVTSQPTNEYDSGANSSMQWGDYTWNDVINGVCYPSWTDRRDLADEDIWAAKICSEPTHWSERGSNPALPATSVACSGGSSVEVTWTAPDLYWGDGGEDNTQRKYQLWVDGSLAQDNISWTSTSLNYTPTDTSSHNYRIRAINQCGYGQSRFGRCHSRRTIDTVYGNGPDPDGDHHRRHSAFHLSVVPGWFGNLRCDLLDLFGQ